MGTIELLGIAGVGEGGLLLSLLSLLRLWQPLSLASPQGSSQLWTPLVHPT